MDVINEFLEQSNAIEDVHGEQPLKDARKAWDFAMSLEKLTPSSILEIHKLLMVNLNPRIAGKVRNVNVMVGRRMCPDPWKIDAMLSGWCEKNFVSPPKTWLKVKQAHVEFEGIHPFEDGNGRTGRIIMNWQRLKTGKKPLVIHAGPPEQYDYYAWFQ